MKNKLGMEMKEVCFKVLVNGEDTILTTVENEIVENVTNDMGYNDVYLKIATLENCKKLVAICDTKYMCDYTKDEILNMSDEEFIKFKMFAIRKSDCDGYYVFNTMQSSFRDSEQAEEDMNRAMLDDYMEWLYEHPYAYSLHKETKDKRFVLREEDYYEEGVYKIQYENSVYIGQTNNFVKRFQQHRIGKSNSRKDISKLLEQGGTFEILELEKDREQRLLKEKKYVEKYILEGYEVVNSTKVLYSGTNKAIKKKRMEEPKMGITFNKSDLDKITKLLSDNNIEFKSHKFRDKKQTKEEK